MSYNDRCNVSELLGKTLTSVRKVDSEEIYFEATDGSQYKMFHSQDCCESVVIEDICGELQDLVGSPLLIAEEVSNEPEPKFPNDYTPESYTWTFYKFATANGYVTIRWLGESNGYYSESVDFERTQAAA